MGALDYLSVNEVNDPVTLSRYIEQQTGTPWATYQDMALLRKKCKEFFKRYPYLDYSTLCHVADWAHRRKRRYSNVWKIVDSFRYAYEDGALPEVNHRRHNEPDLENGIEEALLIETDRRWRTMLIATDNIKVRKEVLENWRIQRQPLLTAAT